MQVRLFTLGCKVNQYETQAIGKAFEDAGYSVASSGSAEVFVVNSCTVTGAADKKTRQLVRRLRRENPSAILVVTGCLPQAAGKNCDIPDADIITGNFEKKRIAELVTAHCLENSKKTTDTRETITKITALTNAVFEDMTVRRFDDSFQRAYIKIEDGCDRTCAYCIIPKARGPVRSKALTAIASEAAGLLDAGYREIVLTGVNLSRFGSDCGLRLPDAVEACRLPGNYRIRLGSLEPDLITLQDIGRYASMDKLCAHFHLALQSGCDATLARMNRPYTTNYFAGVVEAIRTLMPQASVTTDLMVGFPGETDEEFEQTCRFVERMSFLQAHIFEFSPRPNTPAAQMPMQISPTTRRERAKALTAICRSSKQQYAEKQVGKTTRILLEKKGGGYDDQYLYVALPEEKSVGEFINAKIIRAVGECCEAMPVGLSEHIGQKDTKG